MNAQGSNDWRRKLHDLFALHGFCKLALLVLGQRVSHIQLAFALIKFRPLQSQDFTDPH
jgi:hypothetical protein